MSYAIERVIVRRNKQHEWSPPDMKSCFNCGYTSHLINECNYHPPRTRPMNKRDYLNSINQRRQDNKFQRQQRQRPTSYAEAARQQPRNQPTCYFKTWNYDNINRDVSNENYQDDEDINNWNEKSEDKYQFSQRRSNPSRENKRGNFTRNWHSTDNQKIANDTIQEIKNDIASLQDVVKTLAQSLESTASLLNNYINNQKQDKNKEKELDVMQIDGPKKRKVIFNNNNKRPQNADSSDSDSSNNKNNNVTLLSAQISELGSVMKTVTESLNNINNRVSRLDSNEKINRPVVGGSRAVSNNTQNNY
jgi:prefoldin subunit 5